ncbi:acyltransferase family protein [Nocardioides flavescens]|uniref:Acyltransferase family protein n=1 Tax=Nocardioides flavescens TaxID=2691959 RepID=A0A6L7ERH6_9ACTN|nr:acyltransferase family protein [Nocardioides flavescens]
MSSTDAARTGPSRPNFEFIDGLRALAALSVAFFHAFLFTGLAGETTDAFGPLARIVLNGSFAVAIFIVLSGFVLMLPIARRPGYELRDGLRGFAVRRARRILPPYYASFLFFLVLILAVPFFRDPAGTRWAGKVPITVDGVLAHLVMVHNLDASWHDQVNGPLWSVATEVQIYVLMPLVLIPLWRRFGGIPVIALGVFFGWALHFIAPRFDGAHFWYIGLFAAGMLAAQEVTRGRRVPLAGPTAAVGAALIAVVMIAFQYRLRPNEWLTEVGVGLVFALGLFALASASAEGRSNWVIRALESRTLVKIGLFSYSIYLFHSPLIGLSNLGLIHIDMPLAVRLAVMWLVITPAAVALSYIPHLLVERRFMTGHQKQELKTPEPSAVV